MKVKMKFQSLPECLDHVHISECLKSPRKLLRPLLFSFDRFVSPIFFSLILYLILRSEYFLLFLKSFWSLTDKEKPTGHHLPSTQISWLAANLENLIWHAVTLPDGPLNSEHEQFAQPSFPSHYFLAPLLIFSL